MTRVGRGAEVDPGLREARRGGVDVPCEQGTSGVLERAATCLQVAAHPYEGERLERRAYRDDADDHEQHPRPASPSPVPGASRTSITS